LRHPVVESGYLTYVSRRRFEYFSTVFSQLQRYADGSFVPGLSLRDVTDCDVTHLPDDVTDCRAVGGIQPEVERLQCSSDLEGEPP